MTRRRFLPTVEMKKALKAVKSVGFMPSEVLFSEDGGFRIRITSNTYEDVDHDEELSKFFRTS